MNSEFKKVIKEAREILNNITEGALNINMRGGTPTLTATEMLITRDEGKWIVKLFEHGHLIEDRPLEEIKIQGGALNINMRGGTPTLTATEMLITRDEGKWIVKLFEHGHLIEDRPLEEMKIS